MTQDETIALWNKCQAAKKVLLDQGKDEDEAHEAAKEVWNAWAQEMLEQRKELEKAGEWQTKKDTLERVEGENLETQGWLRWAKVEFKNVVFINKRQTLIVFPCDDTVISKPDKENVKSILCEGEMINFTGFIFPSVVDFDFSLFSIDARFNYAIFWGDAWFNWATFSGDAHFLFATFSREARFVFSTFSGDAWFHSVIFSGDAWLFSTTFSGDADFVSARFSGEARFDKATFFRNALFDYAEFEKAACFVKVTFTQKASFSSIISKRSFSLADTHFLLVPDFTEADFHQPPRLDNIHIDRAGGLCWGDKVDENYRALKRQAEDGKDHINEMKFFAGELRTARFNTDFPLPGGGRDHYKEANSKRKQAWEKEQTAREQRKALWQKRNVEKTEEQQEEQPDNIKPLPPFVERKVPLWPNGSRFWFGMAYEFFSDFGRSLLRPVLAIILLKLAFSAYIFSHRTGEAQDFGYSSSMQQLCHDVTGLCTPPQNVASCTYTNPAHATLYLSAQYGLPFMPSSSKQKTMLAKSCLYGWQTIAKTEKAVAVLPDRVIFWGAVQNLFLLIFLFLFGLAVRNHFRMK